MLKCNREGCAANEIVLTDGAPRLHRGGREQQSRQPALRQAVVISCRNCNVSLQDWIKEWRAKDYQQKESLLWGHRYWIAQRLRKQQGLPISMGCIPFIVRLEENRCQRNRHCRERL